MEHDFKGLLQVLVFFLVHELVLLKRSDLVLEGLELGLQLDTLVLELNGADSVLELLGGFCWHHLLMRFELVVCHAVHGRVQRLLLRRHGVVGGPQVTLPVCAVIVVVWVRGGHQREVRILLLLGHVA